MKNWLGQEISVGTVVYRGARHGNYSEYKVGVVESIKDGKVRVAWRYEPSYTWRRLNGQHEYGPNGPRELNSKGSPGIDGLVVLPDNTIDRLSEAVEVINKWKEGDITTDDLKHMLDNILTV